MPLHDWTRVDAGDFHQMHTGWVVSTSGWCNQGGLPQNVYALLEPGRRLRTKKDPIQFGRFTSDNAHYYERRRTVAIRHSTGHSYAALIEITNPAIRTTARRLSEFVHKITVAVSQGIHVLLIDPLPPGSRTPDGIHAIIWRELTGHSFQPIPEKPLTVVSYHAKQPAEAYIESFAVGDPLTDMPLFIGVNCYVTLPLEATYQSAWAGFPPPLRPLLEPPA